LPPRNAVGGEREAEGKRIDDDDNNIHWRSKQLRGSLLLFVGKLEKIGLSVLNFEKIGHFKKSFQN